MAIITSHTLNGLDGTHASGISVKLIKLNGEILFESKMDKGGRLNQIIKPEIIDISSIYELTFDTRAYWSNRGYDQIMEQIVLRFKIPNPEASYHMPIIINPNSYSTWWSS